MFFFLNSRYFILCTTLIVVATHAMYALPLVIRKCSCVYVIVMFLQLWNRLPWAPTSDWREEKQNDDFWLVGRNHSVRLAALPYWCGSCWLGCKEKRSRSEFPKAGQSHWTRTSFTASLQTLFMRFSWIGVRSFTGRIETNGSRDFETLNS